MGKDDNQIIDTTATAARGEDNPSTETASTESGKRGRGRPRKDTVTGREETGGTAEADLPRLVLVDVPPVKESEKEELPKSPKRKRKDIQFELKKEQVAILIKTCFDIAGSREGMEIWKLSQKEAELIAEPLSSILNKNPVIGAVTNKYGDVIALIVATATVLMPRMIMAYQTRPKKNKGVKNYVTSIESNGKSKNQPYSPNQARTDGNNNKQPSGRTSLPSEDFGGKLFDILPSIQ